MKKRVKILKFPNNKVLRLTNTSEADCNVIECGKDRFTLQEFQLQHGHDDSLPYYAKLCLNGKPICTCLNDGWGGQTDLRPLDNQMREVMTSMEIALSKFKWSFGGIEFPLSIDFIADTLACSLANGY